MEPEARARPTLTLPPLVMSPADVSRLSREVGSLDNYLRAQALREPGVPMERLPKLSRLLDELIQTNKLNLLHETERSGLKAHLDGLLRSAPIIHVSFASDPSSASLQKIVSWLRQNIQPDVLVKVGLQPNIAAGCVMWTTNRYFDFSLRHFLDERRDYLLDALSPKAPAEVANE